MYSIIIPTRNEEKAITSTLWQFKGVKGAEIIVSDGNSTDKTVRLAKKLANKIIIHKHSHTIAEARNLGAAKAKGKILIFLDADVRVPDLKKFFSRIDEVFSDSKVVGATVPVYVYKEEETLIDRFFHWMLNLVVILSRGGRGECQIIRREAFKKIGGFDAKLVASEDFEIFTRLRKIGKIKYLTDMEVYESPRRFRKSGYLNVYILYMRNYLSVKFKKKAFSRDWEPIR